MPNVEAATGCYTAVMSREGDGEDGNGGVATGRVILAYKAGNCTARKPHVLIVWLCHQ